MRRVLSVLIGLWVVGGVGSAWADTKFPLRLDIDVSTRTETTQLGDRVDGMLKEEMVSLKLRFRRSSGSPYTSPLKAEVYIIGRQLQTGYLGIIDVIHKDFNFSEERTFECKTPAYRLRQTEGNRQKTGNVYETFLVVVVDEHENMVESRSGRVIRDRGIEFIRKQGKHTLFDRDGNVVRASAVEVKGTNVVNRILAVEKPEAE